MPADPKSTPLVSVALVTYNQHDLLDECLRSILDQDYPAMEIIVADDGSTDGTKDLLEAYDRAHPGRFRMLLADHNRGITANHQAALDACGGKYIAWFAGDDLMLPGKINNQVAHLESNPRCNICYHDVELFDSTTGSTIRLWSDVDRPRSGTVETLVRHGHFNTGISSMVRRSTSPARFEPAIPVASDWLYYVECLASGGTIEPIDGIYARQRRHDRNVTFSADRSQPANLMVEHLQSCAIIIGRWPKLARHARFRMARLLMMQRWQDGGQHYREYLHASLRTCLSWKGLAAWLLSWLGVRR